MQSHLSARDPSYAGSTMCPHCPMKDWRGKSCRLHPEQSDPDVNHGLEGMITSQTLLGPIVMWTKHCDQIFSNESNDPKKSSQFGYNAR